MDRDRYAVIGNPIAHSRSPGIHAAFARQTGENIVYDRLLAPLDGFAASVTEFRIEGGLGLNITLPFKEAAFAFATQLSDRARLAGAVNTLSFAADGSVHADITDGIGFVRDFCENLRQSIHGRRVAVLGAGGAVRGILGEVLAQEPAAVVIANRTLARAEAIVDAFNSPKIRAVRYQDLGADCCDIMINATSASLHDELPPLPTGSLGTGGIAYDLVYASKPTAFMRWASDNGAAVVADGLGMLVEQAAESFRIWRGIRPDTAPVMAVLRNN